MEDVPPSYESAINRDAWTIIAPWISSEDLCSASLVSKKWHNIFAPFLWGDPASHFGTENDAVYVALTRFKRTLKRASLSVRQLTHTLHLPPAVSEIYGGPNVFWLRDVLDQLPNLQSLLVSKLPFFDHQSLIALRQPASGRQETEETHSTYGLKLLLASKESNATSVGISEALSHFPNLVYLDLSYTTPARDPSVLSNLGSLHDIQVLKLRGIGLRDSEGEILANSINTRARVLDVRDNYLTDMAVRSLMQACFLPSEASSLQVGNGRLEDWPLGLPPGPDFLSLDSLRLETLDQQLQRTLTRPLTGRLAFEDIPHKGLTHLYISGNRLSVEGLSSLLSSQRLHVLDGGTVDTAKTITRTRSTSSPGILRDEVRFPGAEKLLPILADKAGQNLTYLRINHAIVTAKLHSRTLLSKDFAIQSIATAELDSHPVLEMAGSARMPVELSDQGTISELPADPPRSTAELPGDMIQFQLSPAVGDSPTANRVQEELPARQISRVLIPEPASNPPISPLSETQLDEQDQEDAPVILNATGTGLSARRPNRPPDLHSSIYQQSFPQALTPAAARPKSRSPSIRQSIIQSLLQKRPYLPPMTPSSSQPDTSVPRVPSTNSPPQLHPSFLPHLQTLILTDVPTHVPESSPLLTSLISFISACADEAYLSHLLAAKNYSLPPGRSRRAAELRHAKTLFALETLVLEMAPPSPSRPSNTSTFHPSPQEQQNHHHGQGRHRRHHNPSFSISSTGDLDSENLWTAAANDFSFFSDQGEMEDECGIYRDDVGKYGFSRLDLEGIIPVTSSDDNETDPTRESPPAPRPRSFAAAHSPSTSNNIVVQPLPSPLSPHSPSSPHPPTTATPDDASPTTTTAAEVEIDVISALSSFRRSKKLEYEQAVSSRPRPPFRSPTNTIGNAAAADDDADGEIGGGSGSDGSGLPPLVEGYWPGEVRVVRSSPSSEVSAAGSGASGRSWRKRW